MRLLIITQKVNMNDPILGFFHRWIIEFAKHCESVIVICLEEGEHELPMNVKVVSLGKERKSSVVSGQWSVGAKLRYILNFYRHIWGMRREYDAVFVHMNPVYVVLGGLLWKMLGKKVSLWYTHKQVDLKLRVAERLVDRVFTASKESFRLPSNKVVVTGHGIDTDYFVPNKHADHDGTIRIVTIGRISATKNIDVMIQSIGILVGQGRDVILTIVGGPVTPVDEKYFSSVKRLVAESNLNDRVIFAGQVAPHETLSYLNDANMFLNLSNTGSLDKAVLEAMACGLVVLTSNEAFRDIVDEWYIKDADLDEVAESICRGIVGPYPRVAMREYIIERHSLLTLVPRLVSLMSHI